MKTSNGSIEIDVPRDRESTFEPMFIEKHKAFDTDLEAKIIDRKQQTSRRNWGEVLSQLALLFKNRLPAEVLR